MSTCRNVSTVSDTVISDHISNSLNNENSFEKLMLLMEVVALCQEKMCGTFLPRIPMKSKSLSCCKTGGLVPIILAKFWA